MNDDLETNWVMNLASIFCSIRAKCLQYKSKMFAVVRVLLLIIVHCLTLASVFSSENGALTDTGIMTNKDEVIFHPIKSFSAQATDESNHAPSSVKDSSKTNSSPSYDPLSTTWWLEFTVVEKFKTLSLPHSTYKQWPSLSLLEKLPYLIDRSYLVDVKNSYQRLCALTDDPSCTAERGIELKHFQQHVGEFNTAEKVAAFFKDCDSLVDLGKGEKGNGKVSWVEYVVCRGHYDATGNPHDVSEFDFLENIVIMDYQRILNDPNHPMVLELIERNEL